jgi:LmbE family N-acetylglucosaminyl deacetylase
MIPASGKGRARLPCPLWHRSCTFGCVSAIIVAAHPDDEVIGLGVLLSKFRGPFTIVHVTDGAPRSGDDARNAGCATWQEYAALRRHELERVLALVGTARVTTLSLDCPDQESGFRIADHARALAGIFKRVRPSVVFTHAYEGGHPDHDATAAAVHAAISLLKATFPVVEFAGYHASGFNGGNGMECECFPGDQAGVLRYPLKDRDRVWKRELLNCYASQARVLAQFPLECEPLRVAPHYDFARAPHEGTLYYERFEWGGKPAKWRALARGALQDLGIPCVC